MRNFKRLPLSGPTSTVPAKQVAVGSDGAGALVFLHPGGAAMEPVFPQYLTPLAETGNQTFKLSRHAGHPSASRVVRAGRG